MTMMEERQLNQYRLFRQGCYDRRRNWVDGYELLMREQVNDQWRVPMDFSLITPSLFAPIVAEAIHHLPGKTKARINLLIDKCYRHWLRYSNKYLTTN